MKRIAWALGLVGGFALAGCEIGGDATVGNCGNVEIGEDGGAPASDAGSFPSSDGEGCMFFGERLPGDSLGACGSKGAKCARCDFAETCSAGKCEERASMCIEKLEAEDAIGTPCLGDPECGAGEWCQSHCCDPVTHLCFVVGACRTKLAPGDPCSYAGGDHECLSGTCDLLTGTCF